MKIAIGGDWAPNGRAAARIRSFLRGSPDPGIDALARLFRSVDLAVVNFEGGVGERHGAVSGQRPRKFLVPLDADAPRLTRALGVGAVSVANNHAFDFGAATTAALEEAGLPYFGGGGNERSAAAPLFVEAAGRRVAFLGWAARDTMVGNWAGPSSRGANAVRVDALIEEVRSARAAAETVIVLPHWGRDFEDLPSPSDRDLGRRIVEAGADAVIGTHPHVVIGGEVRLGKPIVHSTGTLLMDEVEVGRPWGVVTAPPMTAVVLVLAFEGASVRVEPHAFRAWRGRLRFLGQDAARASLARAEGVLAGTAHEQEFDRARRRAAGLRIRTHHFLLRALDRPGSVLPGLGRRLADALSRRGRVRGRMPFGSP